MCVKSYRSLLRAGFNCGSIPWLGSFPFWFVKLAANKDGKEVGFVSVRKFSSDGVKKRVRTQWGARDEVVWIGMTLIIHGQHYLVGTN